MKIKVDLTEQDIVDGKVGFYDSKTIFFDVTTILPTTVSFKVWGADIMPDFNWPEYIDLEKEKNIKLIRQKRPSDLIVIKGFGILTFTNVIAGRINIWPYDNDEFFKDRNRNNFYFQREWSLDRIDSSCFEYWFDTNIYFPYGACDLRLYAKGKVTFEFDTEDCISYMDYITNPNKNETFKGYLNDKSLVTGSSSIGFSK